VDGQCLASAILMPRQVHGKAGGQLLKFLSLSDSLDVTLPLGGEMMLEGIEMLVRVIW
jgi:hypothetical protein